MKLKPPKMFLLNLTQVGGSSSGDGMFAPSRWKMALTCEIFFLDFYLIGTSLPQKIQSKSCSVEVQILGPKLDFDNNKGLGNLDSDLSILCRIEGKEFLQPVEM